MEIFEGNKMTDETLTGVSSISQLNDDFHATLKPSLDGTVGDDPGSVVVRKTVDETVIKASEVSVKVVQDGREDEVMENVEQGEVNEGMENEIEGLFGNFVGDDDDEGMNENCNENGASLALDVEGSFADKKDESASRDDMDICLPSEEPKNDENGNRIFDDENDENREENGKKSAENEDELDEEEESHNFVVGDFVWAKIKSHPWWPGQIYDPSDASDNAAKMKHKGRILVAHFGDGSFSWCFPSQMKPFIDHFPEMSKQSDSKRFVNAVQTALEEIGNLLEVGLMCKCQTVNRVDHAGVVNKGIKKGVPVPKGNTMKVLMERIEPVEMVSSLKDFSAMDPGTGLPQVELTLLKSFLNAFYSKKGGYLLVKFHDPKCIEGLEDDPRKGVVADFDINGDDKSNQRRNRKSVAELLKEDEPTIKKTKIIKDGSSSKRKRKALVVSVTPENDHESGADGGVEEETLSSRQRKKSKYLSPPYLSPVGNGRPELEQVLDAKHLEESMKKSSGKKSRKNRGVSEGSDSQEEQKVLVNGDVNVKKVLHGLLRVALDPASLMEENLPVVTDFVSSYRSSSFKEVSDHQTDKKKNAPGTSDLVFIKQKLETMMEIVKGCDETEMKADVKATLEGGIQEVLQKVGKIKGK